MFYPFKAAIKNIMAALVAINKVLASPSVYHPS
jgi:hypothetical protein